MEHNYVYAVTNSDCILTSIVYPMLTLVFRVCF